MSETNKCLPGISIQNKENLYSALQENNQFFNDTPELGGEAFPVAGYNAMTTTTTSEDDGAAAAAETRDDRDVEEMSWDDIGGPASRQISGHHDESEETRSLTFTTSGVKNSLVVGNDATEIASQDTSVERGARNSQEREETDDLESTDPLLPARESPQGQVEEAAGSDDTEVKRVGGKTKDVACGTEPAAAGGDGPKKGSGDGPKKGSDKKKTSAVKAKNVAITAACVAGGAVLSAGALAVAGPVILGAIGFQAGGIAAGSIAASMMSSAWTTGIGTGVIATLQSAGAAGIAGSTIAATGAAGGAAGGLLSTLGWKKKTGKSDDGKKGPSDDDKKGPSDNDKKGPSDNDKKGPSDNDKKGPSDNDKKGPSDNDKKGPSDNDKKGPSDNDKKRIS